MSESIPPSATSPDTTKRRLILGIVIATLITIALVTADLARGGRPDPLALRAAATLLDGPWKFHVGDDPRWAEIGADDGTWETIDLTAAPGSHDGDVGLPDYVGGWMAQGHPGYHGYAWYRRTVAVPARDASWDVLGPTLVENAYELYWNGKLLGGSGSLGAQPRLVGTRPTKFALPANSSGTTGVLAVRVYMPAGSGVSADGGGLHTAPMLAPRPTSEELHRVQWHRTVAGYVVDAVEPLAMFVVIGLALAFASRTSHPGFLLFAGVALALMVARRLNNALVAWTDLQDLGTYAWLAKVMWIPTVAAWTLAWNRWCPRTWRGIDVAAFLLSIAAIVGTWARAATLTSASRLGFIALFVLIGLRIFREGPMRFLALATLALLVVGLFGGELLDPIGVPGIWFPFGIGVSRTQYVYAIAIPLVAILFVRTLLPPPVALSTDAGRL